MGEGSQARHIRGWPGRLWVAVLLVSAGAVAAGPPSGGKAVGRRAVGGGRPRSAGSPHGRTPVPEPPVARVNNEVITYRQLAEECIARKGPEVLESMISRVLVLQACRERGVRVTAQEIDAEIGRTASRLNMTREQFLKLIKKQRGIPPERYAEDIVLPSLALKKLAKPYVKVTEADVERAFEAHYGEKVKCRWIMFDNQRTAMMVWNQLRDSAKNEDGTVELGEFEHQVMKWSTDVATRSIGGQINPISRHTAEPFKQLEQAAFALKKDGEISKVIQLGEAYVILYREGRIPPAKVKLEDVRPQLEAEIYQAKLMAEVGRIFRQLKAQARIENYLTGDVSLPANQQNAKTSNQKDRPAAKPVRTGHKLNRPRTIVK